VLVTAHTDPPGTVPVGVEGWEDAQPCPSCGWQPIIIEIFESVVTEREHATE
jgi:hypothetical protein